MSCSSFFTSACGANSAGSTAGASLAQMVALGSADTHLTVDPKVTFWRARVKRCTNFAMESVPNMFTGNVAFGSQVTSTIARTGDLVHWLYCIIDIPAIMAQAVPSGTVSGNGTSCTGNGNYPSSNPCDPCDDGFEPNTCCARGSDTGLNCPGDETLFNLSGADMCTGTDAVTANWVNEIGFAAIRCANFSIGGQTISFVYSHYMHMWEELSGQPGKRLEEMIGKRFTQADLVEDSRFSRRLYVPLPFYFTEHTGNALPLVSLQFHTLQVNVFFESLDKLIQRSSCDVNVIKCSDGQPVTNQDLSAHLDTVYIYLDRQERDRFALMQFQQLITQVQQYSTTSRSPSITANLNFNHPTLELMWAVQRRCQCEANNTFNYSGKYGKDPVTYAQLKINNLSRVGREGPYFRMVQPYQHHTNIPRGFIYNYCFALHPEDCQPTGTLNFSRIDNVEFTVSLQDGITTKNDGSATDVVLIMFARNFNVLRFKEGLGGVLYAN